MHSPKVPLTALCPCGSGRKYRNCCWKTERVAYAMGRASIERVMQELYKFIHTEVDSLLGEVEDVVFHDLYEKYSDSEVDSFLKEFAESIFLNISDLTACESLRDRKRTVIDMFLDKQDTDLNPIALEFLTNWRSSSLSLYEVEKTVPRKSILLRDMFSGKSYEVADRHLSDRVTRWETFFLRIVPVGGEYLLTEALYPVPRLLADRIVQYMRDRKKGIRGSRTITWNRFFKKHWYFIPNVWINGLAKEIMGPVCVTNTDGDPVNMLRITLHLKDGSSFSVGATLPMIPGISRESPESYVLISDRSDDETSTMDNVLIATLQLAERELTAVVNSTNRAKSVTELLKEHLGDHIENITLERIEFDPEAMMPHSVKEDEIPQEVKEELITRALDKHYRTWPDIPVPALDGMTPRQAAKDKRMRSHVVSLLKDYELHQPMNGVHYDFSWLWKELGLRRP